ncbi:hypothetical protein VC83_06123 [Pseudogymnoascus destructans]|uniref:C2H2-type domain-containing protein n=2 Tax=Pseudogymnoascus destructans TaxID=655981 RepID=L8FSU4_PSED2|nr:uncharacterized protein VC83_06123 [Pseudogymnoascus destructans]ELR04045.1 hypothetical protein GMDG_06554 [Pseudogymnoascus destructans 20631-21]OAF58830.1 hypothetical protein VC83_06123 [Pseudogymnoascus destructans]
MDYQTQAPWDRPQIFAYNSMMASQVDQQEASYPVDPIHWITNLESVPVPVPISVPRGRSHPDSQQQEWTAQTLESPKAFNDSMQNRQSQQQYSYQEAHQDTYPAPQQLQTSNLPYGSSSASFDQWAPSPGANSRDSSALSPQSERDYRQDPSLVSSPYAAHALTRSHSGISSLSHEADFYAGGGQPFSQQTIPNMSMIHFELDEDPTFRGQEEMFMDQDSGEQDTNTSMTTTLAPRPPTHNQFLHLHLSPAPSMHSHHSPARSYTTQNPPAPRLTPHQTPMEVDDADLDAAFDIDSPLPANDDTDTDGTWTPHAARRTSRTPRRRAGQRPAPPPPPPTTTTRVLQLTSGSRVEKRKGNAVSSSSSSAGRAGNSNPTFPCTFEWAGCTSAFASKNEWKRHVASKHTCFFYWECRVGPCSAPGQSGKFNRKDLFAQHLRRMHSPLSSSAKSGAGKEAWERRLSELLDEGKRKGRAQITKTHCPVPGCTAGWEGARAWDERMEHVARHWEAVKGRGGGGGVRVLGGFWSGRNGRGL